MQTFNPSARRRFGLARRLAALGLLVAMTSAVGCSPEPSNPMCRTLWNGIRWDAQHRIKYRENESGYRHMNWLAVWPDSFSYQTFLTCVGQRPDEDVLIKQFGVAQQTAQELMLTSEPLSRADVDTIKQQYQVMAQAVKKTVREESR